MRKMFCAAALLVPSAMPANATVTFDFFETAVTSCGPFTVVCVQPTQPVPILSITLTASTEAGSAIWNGPFTGLPVVTDPGFVFRDPDSLGVTIAAPDFGTGNGPFCSLGACSAFERGYRISWDDTDGQLDAVNIAFGAELDEVFLGLTGGTIGSDGDIGTCGDGTCVVTGFWQNVSVPEPGSAALLLGALFSLALVGWRYKAL